MTKTASPLTGSSGVLDMRVTSGGAVLASDVRIESIEVRKSFNWISRALIRVIDGDVATGKFPVSDGAAFRPGAAIEISAGYDADTRTIFQGVVVGQALSISANGGALLEVECRDKIAAATVGRRRACFVDQTDSEIIRAILSSYGATVDVEATRVAHEGLVQLDCTDWDYVLARAEVNGLLVSMDDGQISVKAPRTSGDAALAVTYGQDLLELQPGGRVRFQGSARARVGGLVELRGVGDRFSGNALVTSVCHEIRDGNWITEAALGPSPFERAAAPAMAAPPGASPTARPGGVSGLLVGVVLKVAADPANQLRVQVSVPLTPAQVPTGAIWARLSNVYATSGAGTFFPPEVGDEVVLGFFNGDPSFPVVLGSLYSSRHAPPRTPDAANSVKAIVSRSQITIELDDARKVLTLETPGKNTIVVSDQARSILLRDQNGNKVELGGAGIVLESTQDIQLRAAGAISLSASGAIDIKAQTDATMEGLNVTHTAQVAFVAKGIASAELSAEGQTVVRGALVMIN